MKSRIGLVAIAVLVATIAVAPIGTASSTHGDAVSQNAVVHWSGVAEGAIAAGRPPASSTVLAGIVHAAMYDAVAAVEGGLDPFESRVTSASGASADAAVATAARDVLVARVPGQAALVTSAYDAYVASIPPGPARDAGTAVGGAAAAGMLATRADDRFDDVVPHVQLPTGPGVFEPIAPTTPVDVKLGGVRPFTYDSQSEYRPRKPLPITSKPYARDIAEAQAVGRADSALRTAAQTEAARFFTDHAFVQYSRGLRARSWTPKVSTCASPPGCSRTPGSRRQTR